MATTNKENYVDLFIDKGYAGDDPNVFISVNGKNFLLPKGKTSKVPAYVKREYDRAMKARAKQFENSDALQEKANTPV